MSISNKLIETIAENYIEAMTEIVGHASEYGDQDTIDAIIEILRDHDELPADPSAEIARLRADVERLRETIEETLPELRHHVETAKPFTRRRLMELIGVCTAALADTAGNKEHA